MRKMALDTQIYASLHAHSTHSDGVYSPEELVQVGFDEGYRALVLTDHDTVTGTEEMMLACEKKGMECMLGIEFTTNFWACEYGFHVTAFHFDPAYPPMKEYLDRLSQKETDQTKVLFERGLEIGYIKGITWEEVLAYNHGITWLCNEHVFRAMKAKQLVTDLDYREFFDTCYGKYRAQVPAKIQFMDTDQLIDFVHQAGGIAIAAHPVGIYGGLEFVPNLVEYGIDGIEVWHGMLTGKQRRQALALAREYDLYVSGGADHEGLLGGQYGRFQNPQESKFYFPPLSLGTTQYFYEEIRDKQKKPNRKQIMTRMLEDESLWITNGGILDQP
ncbi:MAG: PHP domain-containing protein [Ruminococcaceae bacterium]|nr:PHP domain-containing protein [Oscillospiraceae bacterium]